MCFKNKFVSLCFGMKFKVIILFFLLISSFRLFSRETLPCDSILKRTMAAAERYNGLVEKYEAEVYMRTYVQTLKKNLLYKYTHHLPRFVLHNPNEDEAVIETISTLKYEFPNKYVQNIKYVSGTLTRKKDIELIPFNLLNINIYGESTNDESFFMPLRKTTAKYYRYKLTKTYTEKNTQYYTVEFTPIYEIPNLIKGYFIVEEGTWRIIQFKGEGLDFLSDFSFEMKMGDQWIMNFLPVDVTIYHTASYLGNKIANRYLARIDYKEITLRQSLEKKVDDLNISDYYKIRVDSVPVLNDAVFWNKKRAIPLQAVEKDVLDSFHIKQEQKLRNGNDTLVLNKNILYFAQFMLKDSEYNYGGTRIGYGGLLNPSLVGYSSIDGITYRQRVSFHFSLPGYRSVELEASAGYMFKRKELFTDITTTWNYNPSRMRSMTLAIGNGNPTYSSLFVQQIQDSLVNKGLHFEDISVDYFRDYYFRFFNTFEPTNGLLVSTGFEYHIRKAQKAKKLWRSIGGDTQNIEDMFGTRRSFAPFIRLSWTPEQYYRFQGNQKMYVRSRYPTLQLEMTKSFKDLFGSTSDFYRVEMDISQEIPFGLMRTFNYHIGTGMFTNTKTEYFADFIYFAKNNFPDNWSDGIGGNFNLLRRHLYNASDSYIQAHFMFETPFLFLKNLRFLSELADRERLYFSQLYTPQIVSYSEIGYGIGNKFFKAGVFASFHKLQFRQIGIRAAMGF